MKATPPPIPAAALNSPKDYAYYYRDKLGFSVFPLKTTPADKRKEPAVPSTDPFFERKPTDSEIELWFRINSNYNLAIPMGQVSQAIAFDVDGPNAVKRIESKIAEMSSTLREAFANTMKNKTGSGSEHLVFKVERDISDIARKQIWTDGQPHSQVLMLANKSYIVAAPSVHPNGNKYEWNGKDPQTITRQELEEFIRLISPSGALQSRRQTTTGSLDIPSDLNQTNRTLSPDQMQELLSWSKPFYNPGSRNDMIFYLSGMLRKAGFTQETARRFIKLVCNSCAYPDEDLDKSLTVVDNTYRKDLDEVNGKSGLHDLLVTSYEASSEYDKEQYLYRTEAYSQICQIINRGQPDSPPNDEGGGDAPPPANGGDDDDNDNFPGSWLSPLLEADKHLDINDTLVNEAMKRDTYRTLSDTKEILWEHNGVFRYGGEERINMLLEELGGPEVDNGTRREVIERIKIKTYIDREEFDKDPHLRNVKNGLVDLRTGERYDHDPEKYLSLIQIPHNYYTPQEMKEKIGTRPKGSRFLCKKIVFQFLCNVMDRADVRLAIDFWGYCLIGDQRFQKSLMLIGPPDSGKSKHLDITRAFLGEKNMSHKSLKELTQNRFAKADLYSKLANSCADISSAKLRDIEAFKLISSGDDISAEKKGRDPFTFKPFAKLMFSANTPPLPDEELDDAYYKRWILLVFGMHEKDFLDKTKKVLVNPYLLEEIIDDENELSDLLYLAVQAAKKLVSERWFSGGQRTRDIDIVREEYLRKAVPVTAWVEDRCTFGSDYQGEKADMFADFIEYCDKEKLPRLSSVVALGMKILELYPNVKDHSVGKGKDKRHVWKGIALTSSLRPEDQTEILGDDRYE
jgi:P4 family phage/plasmid primase-like protien